MKNKVGDLTTHWGWLATHRRGWRWSHHPRRILGWPRFRGGPEGCWGGCCSHPRLLLWIFFFFFLNEFENNNNNNMGFFRNFDSIPIFACVVTTLSNRNSYFIPHFFILISSYLFLNGLEILQTKRGLTL